MKINSPFSFPVELDLSACAVSPVSPYYLQSIFIHEGSISSGHYYCYNCTKRNGVEPVQWCMFNDNAVVEVRFEDMMKEALGTAESVVDLSMTVESDDNSLITISSSSEDEIQPVKKQSRLCLKGGRACSAAANRSAYILVYVNALQLEEMAWKNEAWIAQTIVNDHKLTIANYYEENARTLSFYSCNLLNAQHVRSIQDCNPFQYHCWKDCTFTRQFLSLCGVNAGVSLFSQVTNEHVDDM